MALLWQAFDGAPSLASYQAPRQQVEHAGRWPAWRERALTRLRDHVTALRDGCGADRWSQWAAVARDHSELVRVFL